MKDIFLESERLLYRKFNITDIDNLYNLLSNEEIMKYYPSILSKEDTKKWLMRILSDYEDYGIGWWAVHVKNSSDFIGQVGILYRDLEKNKRYLLGYMLDNKFWGRGYAFEAAKNIMDFGFNELNIKRIDCTIRPINTPSVNLAKRLELKFEKKVMYGGYEHDLYFIEK